MAADKRRLVYLSHARRDLLALEQRFALQILDDLPLLESPPWPPGKVKRLRVVNRRDLDNVLGHINFPALLRWFRETSS